LYKILFFVGVFFCSFYNFKGKSGLAANTLLGDMVYRLVFKYLYLTSVQKLFFVIGMMFSGKYPTSTGNTTYQNLIFFMYLIYKMHVFRDHEYFYLLKLSVSRKLITRSFSGDDNLIGYPTVLRIMFNVSAEDYYDFCYQCGLNKKYIRKNPLIGRAAFREKEGFFQEDSSMFIDSSIFLKCSIKDIYETDKGSTELVYRGRYMYRSTADIIFRLCNSDRANKYIESFFAKVLSLMYLAVGNIEAYTILVAVFYLARSVFKWRGTLDKAKILNYLGTSYSPDMDKVFDYTGDRPVIKPPTLAEIRSKYDMMTPILRRPLLTFNNMYKYKVKGQSSFGLF